MQFIRSLFFSTPFIMALSACSTPPPPPPPQIEKTPEPQVIIKDFSSVLGSSFRGQLSYKDNTAYFKPCDDTFEYTIATNNELLQIYKKITGDASTPTYVEFTGEVAFPKKAMAAPQVLIHVEKIQHMALAKASLQCAKPVDDFDFKAKGNDPHWRVNVHDNKLFLATKASNQSYTLGNVKFELTQISHLKSTDQDGQSLSLTITPDHCYMSNNEEFWGYTTKAETNYGILFGCGEPGRLTTDHPFQGYYLSHYQGQEVNMTLNANHTLEYTQGNGAEKITKSGFWKNNTPEKVVVMLTQEGDKTIQEEFVFKRNGVSLSANEINKNTIISEFNAPMVFKQMNAQYGDLESETIKVNREFIAQRISPKNDVDPAVLNAVKEYFKIHRTDPKNTQFSSVKYDLNGDGIDEAIVLLDWCANNGCELLIFEGKETGFRFSSRVSRVQAPIIIAKSQNFSWQSLLTENQKQWLQLDFDGVSYPLNTNGSTGVDKAVNSTGVILFNKGKPTTWFPIK
ncbi:hypothetical protein N8878_02080 [Psychromonas sp.]|nr:hypothetical protein [Psychromonas sp.]